MIAIILEICIVFLKLGLFCYGGGLAILALLQEEAVELGWLTTEQFVDMLAISQSTPGPIAINMATFVGFLESGPLGSMAASISVIIPGFIISLIIARFLSHFNEKPVVKAMLKGLRIIVIGLIGYAVLEIIQVALFKGEIIEIQSFMDSIDLKAIVLIAVFTFLVIKYNKHPLYYILPAGIIGMIIY